MIGICFAAIFSLFISLNSNLRYLTIFGWIITVFTILVLLPSSIWLYVLEPRWWSKLRSKTRRKITNWSIGLLVITVLILIPSGVAGGSSWSGDGVVNLFPEGSTSKNYQLTAKMRVTTKWWWREEYTISSATWPHSGMSYFTGCTVDKTNGTCIDNDGKSWHVEVVQAPDQPYRDN